MRARNALVALALAGPAAAAPKHTETARQTIKREVGFMCENSLAPHVDDDSFRPDATVLVSGNPAVVANGLTAGLANLHAPSTVAIDLDAAGRSAWFQAKCEGEATYEHTASDCDRTKAPHCDRSHIVFHASGLIALDGTWKIQLLALTATDTNQVMLARGDNPEAPKFELPKTVEQKGDAELAKAVTDWFASGDLTKFAAPGTVLAGGSAPDELAMGAAATKLVATWNKMNLALASVDASVVGDRGVVRATVRFQTRKKTIIQLGMTVFAIKDGGVWKWQLLDFVT